MKITKEELIYEKSLTSSIIYVAFLEAMSNCRSSGDDFLKRVLSKDPEGNIEIILTANGEELPIENLFTRWQNEVKEKIREEALKIIGDKCRTLNNFIYDLGKEIQIKAEELLGEDCPKMEEDT